MTNKVMVRVWCLLIGYVFGLFQTAYIFGKIKGVDIRKQGSGNLGTTNTLRVLGNKAGAIVLFGDIMKTGLAMILVKALFKNSYPDILPLLSAYAAFGAVLGHNFPCYLKFKGGKGIACTAGYIIFFHPYLILPEIITFFGTFFATHYVSLGSLLVQIVLVIEMILFGQTGLFGMTQRYLNELYIVTVAFAVLAFWEHRKNIQRLANHCERKTYLTKKNQQ